MDVHSIFHSIKSNDDQIKKVLLNYKKMPKRSNATVVDAMKLRFACNRRYKDLLRRGFPFPSINTLNTRNKNFESEPGKVS